jgi:hypothetical protein
MTIDVQRKELERRELLHAQVAATLAAKRDLDRTRITTNRMASYDTWLVDAVELLLQIELMRKT